jgi:hypothetical protein
MTQMLRLATDENITAAILSGLLRFAPQLDIVRVQDSESASAPDTEMLHWAARERRVVVSHDRKTLAPFAYELVKASEPMYGVIIVSDRMQFAGRWTNSSYWRFAATRPN